VLADSHALKVAENEFWLGSVASPAGTILRRLEEYIVADEVVLVDETAKVHGLALVGAGVGEVIRRIFGGAPASGRYFQAEGITVFPGRRALEENFELVGPEDAIAKAGRNLLAAGARETTVGEMEFIRIAAGQPLIPQDVGPGDLPTEGGLEHVAISYTKGCYLGQEIMARLKNLGRVRRRLHGIHGSGPAPRALEELYQGEKKVGRIRSVAADGSEFVALAMLSLINLDPAAGLSTAPGVKPVMSIVPHG
jgi:folate-binding protein YgfZ